MVCPSIVRVAGPQDYTEVWRLFLQGHHENGQFALAPEKADWHIKRALFPDMIPPWDTGFRGAIGVIGEVGKLEAAVFVGIGSFWYSHARHIEEYIVYVDPECRRSFHARALINWMKERSEATQLPLLTGVISNARTEAKVKLYERMLPKIGAFFLLHPEGSVRSSSSVAA
jgi:hypothetical protein